MKDLFVTSDAVNLSFGPTVIHNLTPFSFSDDSSSFMLGNMTFIHKYLHSHLSYTTAAG